MSKKATSFSKPGVRVQRTKSILKFSKNLRRPEVEKKKTVTWVDQLVEYLDDSLFEAEEKNVCR